MARVIRSCRKSKAASALARELLQHMRKEAHVLFPYVGQLASGRGLVPTIALLRSCVM
jgi:iron-sulfur cluster repair protein YtfE (RIC family)